jgi:D-sedoheptulose 7-phosphate isomerase
MEYRTVPEEISRILEDFLHQKGLLLEKAAHALVKALKSGHKVLVFGNGGSAAEAQHLAAELVNKFSRTRKPLAAVALTTDTSALTSIANDSSYDFVFSRQLQALGDEGDIAIALSTSGTSSNVIEALKAARKKKMRTIALTGEGGGKLGPLVDFLLDVPSRDTPRLQEVHLVLLHLIARELDERLSGD